MKLAYCLYSSLPTSDLRVFYAHYFTGAFSTLAIQTFFVGPHRPCSHDTFFLVFSGHDTFLLLIVVLCLCSLFSSSYLNFNTILGTSCKNSSPLLLVHD